MVFQLRTLSFLLEAHMPTGRTRQLSRKRKETVCHQIFRDKAKTIATIYTGFEKKIYIVKSRVSLGELTL